MKCVNLHVNVSNNFQFSVSYLYICRSINLPAVEKAVRKVTGQRQTGSSKDKDDEVQPDNKPAKKAAKPDKEVSQYYPG